MTSNDDQLASSAMTETDRQRHWTGRTIRLHRTSRLCLTQHELADKLGAAQESVSNWERGQSSVAIRYRRPLAAVLGLDPAVLFAPPPEDWQPNIRDAA